MKHNGPKVKIARRLGIALTKKAARYMEKKAYPPGIHGPSQKRFRPKMSVFKIQLIEKQRLRAQYNIKEKQMRNYYKLAAKRVGNTADNLIQLLESRLDMVVFRGGLAPTIYAARQYVSHGHITLNGKKVDIPSCRVKPEDVVSVKEKSRKFKVFLQMLEDESIVVPDYLESNRSQFEIKLMRLPERVEVPIICEVPLVIEYYSR